MREMEMSKDDYVTFQAIAWFAEDINDVYTIKIFGVDEDNYSIALCISDFKPYFYIRVPDFWTKVHADLLQYELERLIDDVNIIQIKLFLRKDFWGFTNNTTFNFARLDFGNLDSFKRVKSFFDRKKTVRVACREYNKFRLYEANIDPYLRLIHIKNIKPSGWLRIKRENTYVCMKLPSTCQTDIECSWKDLNSFDSDKVAQFIIASFDIECNSSHGDFPVPIKDYRKPALELTELYKKHANTLDFERTNIIRRGMYSLFGVNGESKLCSPVYPQRPVKDLAKLKKAIDMVTDDIVMILKNSIKDHNTCITKLLDKFSAFPKLAGDQIIAIGVTVHKYSETECTRRYVLSLGSCDKIDGVDVRVYDHEPELIIGFRDLIVNEVDPDVVTGYNINGFDFWYLHERAIELGVWDTLSCLGRIKDHRCAFVEQKLSSSALGDNLLKYIDMHGRVVLDVMKVIQRDHKLDSYKLNSVASHFLGENKHDVSPQDIFRLWRGNSNDRRVVADYCIQDCALCNYLVMKLEIFASNIGMSNVCLVPLHYIFVRGQGIKIFSLVMKECKDNGVLIPVIKAGLDTHDDSYEGAIVLEPQTGIYINEPVSILDYASLYPSSMISENLSHDCIVLDPKYGNIKGVEYLDVPYDVYDKEKNKVGERICRYVQPANGEKGLIPQILQKLLRARKSTLKRIEMKMLSANPTLCGWYNPDKREFQLEDGTSLNGIDVNDVEDAFSPFQKAVLDGLQNAYKITANSLYGQCGARTSPIYMKDIAACTTATGRRMILKAKKFLEDNYNANIIYGDTDSIFCVFPQIKEKGHAAIMPSIQLAMKTSCEFRKTIKAPQDLKYEKTFWPFILLSKKRYVGNKYEMDDLKFQQNSMGIVLKRRDNAPIVKTIYGGIVDIILNKQDINASVNYLKDQLERMKTHDVELEELVISKGLRAEYRDPSKIAHKVLAERMGERDMGNKPQVNDRIPFVYIMPPTIISTKKILQGERIEHVDYIKHKGLKPDIAFYITNQVMSPVCQLLAIVLEQLPGYKHNPKYFKDMRSKLSIKYGSEEVVNNKIIAAKEVEVKKLLFDPVLDKITKKQNRVTEITDYFQKINLKKSSTSIVIQK